MQIIAKTRARKQLRLQYAAAARQRRERPDAEAGPSSGEVAQGAVATPDGTRKRTRTEIQTYREARTYATRDEEPKRAKRRVTGTAVGIDLLQRMWGLHADEAEDRRRTRKRSRTPRICI